jgi:two-component system nitrogen regulation sensor histidine kinase NtrY
MSIPSDSDRAPEQRRPIRRRARIILLALATALLFALLFTQAAFDLLPLLSPSSASETLILYALSMINFTAFVVLLMILARNILKLQRERREMKLGARFKTRLVIFFIALSLLPVLFLFFATSGLINRSVDKWFSLPAREMVKNARQIQEGYVAGEQDELRRIAVTLARLAERADASQLPRMLDEELRNQQLLLLQLYQPDGQLIARAAAPEAVALSLAVQDAGQNARLAAARGETFATQVREGTNQISLIAATPFPPGGVLVAAQKVPPELAERVIEINKQEDQYDLLSREQKRVKGNLVLTLALITLLVLFIATWMALYLARSVAGPVQQLAQATERIKRGDLTYRADIVGDDELAALALSFNQMTAELGENRRRLEHSTAELQQTNAALDERRRYIEAILQSLSAGVISLDEHNHVTTINAAALRLLRLDEVPAAGAALEGLLPEEQRDELRRLIRRAARLRSITREVHFTLANHVQLDAAVTVTALRDPQGQSRGTVIVVEDLTELIEAQRRAAWSEVARRMAHEIKNPLTPIRLSAERLAKNLLASPRNGKDGLDERHAALVRECTAMIGKEVATLQRMVDEFSNFARLPSATLTPASLNEVIASTVRLYDERLDGIQLESRLQPALPLALIDSEQIKRALVNLIDNAAEALAEADGDRRITIETREEAERETVAVIVSDNGPGIPTADRERVFEPYFSTRKRGTGLGLAIVSHIVAEHHGRLRVQDNLPHGARFTIELPSAKGVE